MDRPTFILIHSPLVGPLTWQPVADRLRAAGNDVLLPELVDRDAAGEPYWRQEAESAARAVIGAAPRPPLILVGHSGAGALLPAIGQALGQEVGGLIFVDAGIHRDGWSRLDAMQAEAPVFAGQLRTNLQAGGRFPEWQDEQLREIVPDTALRRALLADLRPRGLPFFEEPIPVDAGIAGRPSAYIRFSATYDGHAAAARAAGWPERRFEAGHFHMLVDAGAVAAALLELGRELQPN